MASIQFEGRGLPIGQAVGRGIVAAHGALIGAVYLALLHAPVQLTNALGQQPQSAAFAPGQEPAPERVGAAMAVAGVTFLLGLAVFFVFPLIQGGILGQVRDRLEQPDRPAGSFRHYARAHYASLLGSQGLFFLTTLAVIVPLMVLAMFVTTQAAVESLGSPVDQEPVVRSMLRHPVMIASVLGAMAVLSAAGMVYWMANCAVVAEGQGTLRAWAHGFDFCRRNLPAVAAVWLVNLVVGSLIGAPAMLGQFGVIAVDSVNVPLALLSAAATGYWGVLLAGMCMSVFLGRRTPAESGEPHAAMAGAGR